MYMHAHSAENYQTLREARNSIPRATWKLNEIRSSRNKGELEAELGSRRVRDEGQVSKK